MFSISKLAQVNREMGENKLHTLGISEYRWIGLARRTMMTAQCRFAVTK